MGMKMEAGSADEFRGGQSAMGQSGLCNNRYPQPSWVLGELYIGIPFNSNYSTL